MSLPFTLELHSYFLISSYLQAKRKRFSTALHSIIFFFQIEHNGNRNTNLKDGNNRDIKFKGREHDRTDGIRGM